MSANLAGFRVRSRPSYPIGETPSAIGKIPAMSDLNSSTQQGKWTRSVQLSRPTQFPHLILAPMTRSVILDARQRQALLDQYRKDPDPEVRFAPISCCCWPMATPGPPSRRSCSAAPGPSTDGSSGSTGKESRPWPGTGPAGPFASVPDGWPSSSTWSVPKSRATSASSAADGVARLSPS